MLSTEEPPRPSETESTETLPSPSIEDSAEPAAAEENNEGEQETPSIEGEQVSILFAEEQGDESRDALKAVIEAAIYITDEPLTPEQIAGALGQPLPDVKAVLAELVEEYAQPSRGLSIRELAGGYKMATKPEHHESIRAFVKKLQPPLKLSLPALETLAVIAYKQPITAPEIMEIRGVQGAGVLKTLLDRKLVATAGRKDVVGKPILYKTTREFLIQFGLSSLKELPTLKEFEELGRLALADEGAADETAAEQSSQAEVAPEQMAEESPAEEGPQNSAEADSQAEPSIQAENDEPPTHG